MNSDAAYDYYRAAEAELEELWDRLERCRDAVEALPRRSRRRATLLLVKLDEHKSRLSRLTVTDVLGPVLHPEVPTAAEAVAIDLGIWERNLPALVAALQLTSRRIELASAALFELLASTVVQEIGGDLTIDIDRGPPGHVVMARPAQPHAPPRRFGAPLERARADRLLAA